MRKIISFVLIFAVLAALIPALPARASAAGGAVSAPVDSLSPEAALAFHEVLVDKATEWGINYAESNTIVDSAYGLVYADLIDFEGDGVPELYLYTIPEEYDPMPEEEIWRFNGMRAERFEVPEVPYLEIENEFALMRRDGKVYFVTSCEGGSAWGENHNLFVNEFAGEHSGPVVEMYERWSYERYEMDSSYSLTINGNAIYEEADYDTEGGLTSAPEAQAVYDRWPESQWYLLFDNRSVRSNDVRSLMRRLWARAGEKDIARIDPRDPLASVAYMGDRTRCQMDAQMALAYAEALEKTDLGYTALIDLGDGYPVTVSSEPIPDPYVDSSWESPVFHEYQNGKAVVSQFVSPYSDSLLGEFAVCDSPEGKVLRGGVTYDLYTPENGAKYYKSERGRLRLWHTVTTEETSGGTAWVLDGTYSGTVNPAEELGITEDYEVFYHQILGDYPGEELRMTNTAVTAAALRAYARLLADTPTPGPVTDPTAPEDPPEDPTQPPETPDTTPETPDTTPETPDTTPETPDTTPETPDTTPETPDTTPEAPDTTPKTPDTTPESPDITPEASGMASWAVWAIAGGAAALLLAAAAVTVAVLVKRRKKPSKRLCPHCGSENGENTKFCTRCGTKL